MNRQERRRNNRKKNTTYNLTPEQIASITRDSEKKVIDAVKDDIRKVQKEEVKELVVQALTHTFYIPLLTLRNMGWGKKRLERFANKLIEQWDYFDEGAFTAEDIREVIIDETGINIVFNVDYKNQKINVNVK